MDRNIIQQKTRTFRYKRQAYTSLGTVRIRDRVFDVVERFGDERYKIFDQATGNMRSLRLRKGTLKYEMKLTQFSRLQYEAIPTVIEHWEHRGVEYLLQAWIEGFPLKHFLRIGHPGKPYFNAERSYFLIRGLVQGLTAIHRIGVYHGDLKPENLICNEHGRIYLIDFGSAWSGAQAYKRWPEGSRFYAAPEQMRQGMLADHRADQFAASVILYQMLTGEIPYEGLGGEASSANPVPPLIPPRKKNPTVWRELDHVVMQGLSLGKEQRYATSQEWLANVKAAAPLDEQALLRQELASVKQLVRNIKERLFG